MSQSAARAICQFVPPFVRFLREGLAQVPISPARFQVLEALKLDGALSMVELAERLTVTKRNITSLVDGLEKDGLVSRTPHPTDRRSTLVSLTTVGDSTFCSAAKIQHDHLAKLMEGLNDRQKDEMAQTLTYLTQKIQECSDT
ncbi:MarR family transcriptional regulator [Ruegeria sp. R13_0]|uniref:MarR family winged helix-turn-helix transcriptional regulator n=1 Tax=Ruegeria sp. R13_0 TaxID=2821099 RepID=UPI001ADC78E3|nr:MarR family transcriptional regulator [Ruegeria sp. R13_0]MBO9436660.1 MarR family transcriptional regulator [Ruegeria sp. R13_0]